MKENDDVRLPDRQPTTRLSTMPRDTNPSGNIFGGWIMSQVDIAGAIVAMERANSMVATVAVNAFEFKEPVFVGDIVSCYATVTRVGNTSITVDVEVYAQRNPEHPQIVKVTEAILTYVALDENRKPRPISK